MVWPSVATIMTVPLQTERSEKKDWCPMASG
jgi:hypothetical protein